MADKKRVWNKSTGRDYSKEREYLKKTAKQRAQRNAARRKIKSEYEARYGKSEASRKLKGKDVDHKRTIKSGGSNSRKNLRVVSKSKNRARK